MSRALTKFTSILFVLWGVSTLTFLVLHFTPGDPVDLIMGDGAAPSDKARLRAELNLDKPVAQQYLLFFGKLARGDVGASYMTKKNVFEEIGHALPNTIYLGLAAVFVSVLFSIPMGLWAAARKGHGPDHFVDWLMTIGAASPSFVIGPILIIFLSVKWGMFPVSGTGTLWHLFLPTMSLSFGLLASLTGITRASCRQVLDREYVRVATSKGLGPFRVLTKHVLANALTPIITWISLQLGLVLTGVVITETLFDWPGLGILFFTALKNRDFPMVQGCTLTVAIIYIAINLLTDIVYTLINPRSQEESGATR